MFNIWDRSFIEDTPENREFKVPKIDGRDGKLLRGMTQENIEMHRCVKIERERAMKREEELHKEMHSFGMIECSVFDDQTKLMLVHMDRTQAFNIPVKSSSLSEYSFIDATISAGITSGCDIALRPMHYTYENGTVATVNASGMFVESGKTYGIEVYFDISGDDAVAVISLAGAVVDNGRLCVPIHGKGAGFTIPMNLFDCYK